MHALETPSLQRLSFVDPTPALTATPLIKLTNLTHLTFETRAFSARNPLLQSMSCLPGLQHLEVKIQASDQVTSDERQTALTLPPTWRQLSSLTAFHLTGHHVAPATFQLQQLPTLIKLRDLFLCLPCTGALSDISHLTRLTKLSIQHPLEGAGPSEDTLQGAGASDGARPYPYHPDSSSSAEGSSVCASAANLRREAGGTSVAAPALGWSQLQQLFLHGPVPSLVAVLPQLTALTHLRLCSFAITPDLCWWVPSFDLPLTP